MAASSKPAGLHSLEQDLVHKQNLLSYCEQLRPEYVDLKRRVQRTEHLDVALEARYDMVRLNMDMLLDELFQQNVMIEAYENVGTATPA